MTLLVVSSQLLAAPAATAVEGLYGVHRTHDLVVEPPDVLVLGQPQEIAGCREVSRGDEPKVLVEVSLLFLDPLENEAGRSNDQDASSETPRLQLAENEP